MIIKNLLNLIYTTYSFPIPSNYIPPKNTYNPTLYKNIKYHKIKHYRIYKKQ